MSLPEDWNFLFLAEHVDHKTMLAITSAVLSQDSMETSEEASHCTKKQSIRTQPGVAIPIVAHNHYKTLRNKDGLKVC